MTLFVMLDTESSQQQPIEKRTVVFDWGLGGESPSLRTVLEAVDYILLR